MGRNNREFENRLDELAEKSREEWTNEDYIFVKDTLVQTLLHNDKAIAKIDKNVSVKEHLWSTPTTKYNWDNMPSDDEAYNCFMFYMKHYMLIKYAAAGVGGNLSNLCCPPTRYDEDE